MKYKMNSFILIIFIFFIIFAYQLAVSAALPAPYHNYTFDFWGNPVPAPQAYLPVKIIEGLDLGLQNFNNPEDLFITDNGQIYVVDTGNNRIVKFSLPGFEHLVFDHFYIMDIREQFNRPQGIYIRNNKIYIADTENRRIVILDVNGDFLRQIKAPGPEYSDILPENFIFNPLKIAVNPKGEILVLGRNIYDGIMLFDQMGDFRGFIGAPRVTPGVEDIFWKRFGTREQRARMALFLPTEYRAVDITPEGFILVTENDDIKMLTPDGGSDKLRTTGFHPPQGDIIDRAGYTLDDPQTRPSFFVDIISRTNGIYSVLDRRRGRIFTYDRSGNLLYIFGGPGHLRGLFRNPVALDVLEEKGPNAGQLVILDKENGRLTFFAPTTYTGYIHAALWYYEQGRSDKTETMWEEVLKLNTNYDLAYSGIGRIYLSQNEFEKAMFHFRLGNNRKDYSRAFRFYRELIIKDNFGKFIMYLGGLILLFLILFKINTAEIIRKRIFKTQIDDPEIFFSTTMDRYRQQSGSLNKIKQTALSTIYALKVIFHPFSGFWDLKHDRIGTLFSAVIIIVGLCLSYVFMRQYTGFIFNPWEAQKLNIYKEFAVVLIPFLLWCTSNWALTTLMDGKGSFREIVITTSYALVPLPLINFPLAIISNFMLLEEGSFYYFFIGLALVWSLLLLFSGMMTIHEFDLNKNLLTSSLTVIGMGATMVIILLFFVVIGQVSAFISSIYYEITFRL